MIEKMSFVTVTGPKNEIDVMAEKYLSRYEIHLEHATSTFGNQKDVIPFVEVNVYAESHRIANELAEWFAVGNETGDQKISIEEADAFVKELNGKLEALKNGYAERSEERKELENRLVYLKPFEGLNAKMSDFERFSEICYRVGKVPEQYMPLVRSTLFDNPDMILYECGYYDGFVYALYFSRKKNKGQMEAVCRSLHCEFVDEILDGFSDAPSDEINRIQKRLEKLRKEDLKADEERAKILKSKKEKFLSAKTVLDYNTNLFDIRKYAACTMGEDDYYILCGWMKVNDAKNFKKELKRDPKLEIVLQSDKEAGLVPPTKLKNFFLFRPFEMFVEMYGLPNYKELDPTIFVALTYAFIFGAMFGDVGQGLCLLIGGAIIYAIKKMRLAAIISMAGIFSTFFGFMFGSFFGFEGVIPTLWLSPTQAMTEVPVIGLLNTVFVLAVGFGMGLMLFSMILNMINCTRLHDKENGIFSANGLMGMIFFGTVVTMVVLLFLGKQLPSGIIAAVLLGISLIGMALKKQLGNLIERRKAAEKTGIAMTILETFFELFETMLSYFSNTLSFVRIGAFAVSHVAMMEVIMMLAGAESGNPSWITVILGNIFVLGFEGLIVGIQVLRLEYYELFSRYYRGDGKEFIPFIENKDVVKKK